MKKTRALSSSQDIRKKIPLSKKQREEIALHREEIQNILAGKDERFLIIVGPCSAWPGDPVITYSKQLKEIADTVKEKAKIVMRVYTQKPRSTRGWAGAIVQPNPFTGFNVEKGVLYARETMREIASLGLPVADEILFTHLSSYTEDMLSWAAIGARSVEDQEHRALASGLDCPVGMKNPTSGNVRIAVNAIISAQGEHVFVHENKQTVTTGNPHAHIVLRGGADEPNYSRTDINMTTKMLIESQVENPAILIDLSHDNSRVNGKKLYERQIQIMDSVLRQKGIRKGEYAFVKGVLIESFLQSGRQDISQLDAKSVDKNGLSITDGCIGIDETRELIFDMVTKYL